MKSKTLISYSSAMLLALIFGFSTALAQDGSISGDVQPCANSSILYSYNPPSLPSGKAYTLVGVDWYLDGSIVSTNGGFGYNQYFDPSSSGNKTISATAKWYYYDNNGNQAPFSYTGTLQVSVRQSLSNAVSDISPSSSSIECGQTPSLSYSVSVTGISTNLAYSWTLPSGWSAISATNGASITVQAAPYSGGAVSVTVTDTKCNTSVTRTANISRTIPTLGYISGGAGCFCSGQTQSFSVPAVSGATSYQWAASGSLYIASGQGTNTVSIGTSGSGGDLTCYAVTACGNTNTSGSNYIFTSTSAPPTPTLTLVGSSPCTDYRRDGTLSITNADPCATYYWSGDAGVVVSGSGSSAAVGVPYSGLRAYVYGVNACGTGGSGSRTIPATPNCGGGQLRAAGLSITAAPNPFSDRTTLSYSLSEDAEVTLDVTTSVGKRVVSLINERQKAGDHDVTFDGSRLPTGVYVATLTVTTRGGDRQTASVQMTLTR